MPNLNKSGKYSLPQEESQDSNVPSDQRIDLDNENKTYLLPIRFSSASVEGDLVPRMLQAIEDGAELVVTIDDKVKEALALMRIPSVPTSSLVRDVRSSTGFFANQVKNITVKSPGTSDSGEDDFDNFAEE